MSKTGQNLNSHQIKMIVTNPCICLYEKIKQISILIKIFAKIGSRWDRKFIEIRGIFLSKVINATLILYSIHYTDSAAAIT